MYIVPPTDSVNSVSEPVPEAPNPSVYQPVALNGLVPSANCQSANGVTPELGGIVSREYDEDRNLRRITVADAADGGVPRHPDQYSAPDPRSNGQRPRIARPGGGDHQTDSDPLGRRRGARERRAGHSR